MVKDMPVDVGLIYEGERIRKANMFVDLAGPKSKGVELLQVVPKNEIKDGKVEIIGPDISKMEEGGRYPFGIHILAAGDKLEEDLEGVFERRNHDFSNFIQGFMHLNSRDIIWCRISKEAAKKGLSLKHVGQALMELYKNEYSVIDTMQVTYITDPKAVEEFMPKAREVFDRRDAKARGLKDEDVDTFYGCVLCQSFAPTHVCTITPTRTSSCGAITWFEGRAASKIDPEGPIFALPKGDLLDADRGEYSGINDMSSERSNGDVTTVYLHSLFEHPHTSCGCFEAIAFYIPEADGIGIVHRDFQGVTPFGIPFSTMAGQVGGGVQSQGFMGIGIEYLRSPNFLRADGGWNRVVWMPSDIKERVKDSIPEEMQSLIATEADATGLDDLKEFLKNANHPVVKDWIEEEEEMEAPQGQPAMQMAEMQMPVSGMVMPGGGEITIIFKNAKIYAEKVIITRKK